MTSISYYTYVASGDVDLFTNVCLPDHHGQFPTVIYRSPYVDSDEALTEGEIAARLHESHKYWLAAGYAVVLQHCRGRGKSGGDCIPYIHEREDGLALQEWVRQQPFYNGELFLHGSSYCASVHFVTAPFADDIKGVVLEVQDQSRYNCNYRNGFYKSGLHGNWYVDMYKKKAGLTKSYTPQSYRMLPLCAFSETVFGEKAADFDAILQHPDPSDPFWDTRFGGGETKGALDHATVPILLVTGFYDIYTGGIFDMWNGLSEETRRHAALLVHPYAHNGSPEDQPIAFEQGDATEAFGDYPLRFFDFLRGKGESPVPFGKVSYYKLFGNEWCCDDFAQPADCLDLPLGTGERTYCYNPYDPASFRGGLSANFGGTAYQDPPNSRYDILSFYTDAFDKDVFVKGRMSARLRVRSDCEDTCFYMRLSLTKPDGDYGLRDDILALSSVAPDYRPGDDVTLDFTFDEHAFVIRQGEKLRIDISSSAFPLYIPHTNRRGPFAEQTTAAIAHNTVLLDGSSVRVPLG